MAIGLGHQAGMYEVRACKGMRKENDVKGSEVRWFKVEVCGAINKEVGVCIVSVCEVFLRVQMFARADVCTATSVFLNIKSR
jgi:hypothetical protein